MTTACPLDCYDACRIHVDNDGKIKGDASHPITKGFLCPHLMHYHEYECIKTPRYLDQPISMEDALAILKAQLSKTEPTNTLYFRGSGNLGLMQRSVEHFFSRFGATGTHGSLCDGAGEAGILQGRGVNYPLSPEMIKKSDVVVIWGRNIHTTHSHLLPYLKDKKLVVIDPLKTKIANMAHLYLQIKPHGDLHLALLFSKLLIQSGLEDKSFIKHSCSGYEQFRELLETLSIDESLDASDIRLEQIEDFIEMIKNQKTVFLVGVGTQKYRNGANVLRAIDSLGAVLGLFGKVGSGISYLGSSLQDLTLPFDSIQKTTAKPTIDFSQYDFVFIQGSNPLAQLPDTSKVTEEYQSAKFKIYFGLYENETSQASDLVLPALPFLQKMDFRASYGDFTLQQMPLMQNPLNGISEYDLAQKLCKAFEFDISDEKVCLKRIKDQIVDENGVETKAIYPKIPYQERFETEDKKFHFLENVDLNKGKSQGFHLITSKSPRSLNSQFKREEYAFLNPDCGFTEEENVWISSEYGKVQLPIRFDERLRSDCILIYSGTPGVNHLTPSILSDEGESAVYQENQVKVEK